MLILRFNISCDFPVSSMLYPHVPGSHRDLLPVLAPFAERGYRVLLPNFPGYGLTRCSTDYACYTHSTREQAHFLHQFLRHLSVGQLHLVAGHSAGCCPLWKLCAAEDPNVRAVLMVAPMHGHVAPRGMEPHWMVNTFGRLYYAGPVGKWLVKKLYKMLIRAAQGDQNEQAPDEAVEAVIQIGLNAGFGDYLKDYAKAMAEKKVPMLYVFADRDPLMWEQVTREFAGWLGIRDEDIDVYSAGGELVRERGGGNNTGRGLMFRSKSHTPQLEEYNHVIVAAIDTLIRSK